MSGATSHGWCTILGRARLEGPLSQLFPWKIKPRPICLKLTGDLPHGRGCLPWRWKVPTTIPRGAVQVWVNVLNHVRSHQLKNEVWPICLKFTGDLPHGRDIKMASPYHHPSRSSTSVSKCAKSRQEPPAEKWSLADLLETHRGPAPSWGQHHPKTAGPYLKPPWSSTAQSICPKSCQEPPAEKWSLADLLETHRGPVPDQGPPSLKMVSP